jgi:hypothetical protein
MWNFQPIAKNARFGYTVGFIGVVKGASRISYHSFYDTKIKKLLSLPTEKWFEDHRIIKQQTQRKVLEQGKKTLRSISIAQVVGTWT